MKKRYYITCAIDYANGLPHLGHAIEKIGTDIRLRWTTAGGTTNTVQAAAAITGPFEDITPPLTQSGVGEVTLEYTDLNATTQPGSRFYRIKRL